MTWTIFFIVFILGFCLGVFFTDYSWASNFYKPTLMFKSGSVYKVVKLGDFESESLLKVHYNEEV